MTNATSLILMDKGNNYLEAAALELKLSNNINAVVFLSYAVSYIFYATLFSQPEKNLNSITEDTIESVLNKIDQLNEDKVKKFIIYNCPPDSASDLLFKITDTSNDKHLFWIGYFNAEHWDNREALKVFDRLVNSRKATVDLHWKGNLLGKLGRFEEALPFLLATVENEPERYNHFSHLGNAMRNLKRKTEAENCYKKAINLINQHSIGRVEYIHLVRCYYGLFKLGFNEYQEFEKFCSKEAVQFGLVKDFELERIKD